MEKDKKKRPWVTYLALAQLAIAVAIMTYGTFSKKLTGRQSDILITASLLIFCRASRDEAVRRDHAGAENGLYEVYCA